MYYTYCSVCMQALTFCHLIRLKIGAALHDEMAMTVVGQQNEFQIGIGESCSTFNLLRYSGTVQKILLEAHFLFLQELYAVGALYNLFEGMDEA